MADRSHPRLPVAVALGAVACLLAVAPAPASEGPPGAPGLPGAAAPVVIPPLPVPGVTAPVRARRLVIRRARITPRRVRRGHRATVRMTLSEPGRVRVVVRRRSGRRVAAFTVLSVGRRVVARLPRRSHGRLLRPGRYVVRLVATTVDGRRSRVVRRVMRVRRAAR
jgi:hypothetical protein